MRIWLRGLLLSLGFCTLVFPLCAQEAKAPKQGIMVWRLEQKEGVTEANVDSLSGFLTSEVERLSGNNVISEADIRSVLKGEEARQKCGAENSSCVVEIGAALGVPEAISGDLGRVGEYWILNLRRLNVRQATVIKRSSRNIRGDINTLVAAIPQAVGELFGVEVPAPAVVPSEPKMPATPVVAAPPRVYPMNPYKQWGHAAFWTGLGFAAFGGVATWQAQVARNQAKDGDWSADSRQRGWKAAAITGYALGGALLVTGIVLWAVSPGDQAWWEAQHLEAAMAPSKGGAVLSLGGRW